jgi:uncharacterized membrane protein YccC
MIILRIVGALLLVLILWIVLSTVFSHNKILFVILIPIIAVAGYVGFKSPKAQN